MIRRVLVGLAPLACVLAFAACGDETPAEEHAHVCTDGEQKCEGDLVSTCSADKFGTAEACPTAGQKCTEMPDAGAMCM